MAGLLEPWNTDRWPPGPSRWTRGGGGCDISHMGFSQNLTRKQTVRNTTGVDASKIWHYGTPNGVETIPERRRPGDVTAEHDA